MLAWIIPNLFILELIPTKLPHYTLPLYPALSLLSAVYITSKVNIKKFNIVIITSNVIFIYSFYCLNFLFL